MKTLPIFRRISNQCRGNNNEATARLTWPGGWYEDDMLFSSITFLFVFLPIMLMCYFIVPYRWKNSVLLISSLIFYFFGEPKYTLLLLISSVTDYLLALYIESHRGQHSAKLALITSMIVNLTMLGVFKYADFAVSSVNRLSELSIPLPNLALPVGISFFTFQTMSYTIDVYRGEVHAENNLATMATYVCLFPQLVAGPIVRYSTVAEEMKNRHHTWEDAAAGTRRFILGLAKKVLIANNIGELSNLLLSSKAPTVSGLWLGSIAFVLQIYFDFSGYSDMAIGLGKLFGFNFPENFNYPFISKSITEFWRRWHMTLGSWFRDYLYIPLGGNRVKRPRWVFNIAIVWMLTGLWHGADWNFVLWGLFFAVFLIVEKLYLGKWLSKAPALVQRVYTLFLVLISFVIFNGDAKPGFAGTLSGMFGGGNLPFIDIATLYYLRSYAVLLAVAVIGSTPLPRNLVLRISNSRFFDFMEVVICAVLLLVVTAYLVDGSFNPFLYFRF